MTAALSTLAGVLQSGTHASRPAATTVPVGTLYAETDTKQTYQSNGASWNAWGGGGTGGTPTFVQQKYQGVQGSSLTLDATPIAGHTIILGINRLGTSTTSAVSSTNTTWTMLLQWVNGGSCMEIWAGVCAASPGATISYTAGSSNYNSARAIEIVETVTPTTGVSYAAAAGTGHSLSGATSGHYMAVMGTNVNTGITTTCTPAVAAGHITAIDAVGIAVAVVALWVVTVGSLPVGANTTNASDLLMVEVS